MSWKKEVARKTGESESVAHEARLRVSSDADIVAGRQKGREMARQLGMTPIDMTLIAAAISELVRNIVLYAGQGEIRLQLLENPSRSGILIVAHDEGPGIVNVPQAMQEGYSTSRSLGLGLPGVKRLMDEFDIVSERGRGTTVKVVKWK